jgi:uncharacterized membrane protein YjjP (DUF1212 family)
MWRRLIRDGARHPRWNIFFGVAVAGVNVALLIDEPADVGAPVAMIALGTLSTLIGVLGLYDRRRA